MNLSIQKRNLRFVYYIVLTILIFMLMTPGVMLPSILRIALLILIFFPVICNIDEFPFVFVTFYGISSISFTPVLPTSDIYYVVIVITFYILNLLNRNKKRNKFLIGCLPIYVYFLISSLLHLDYDSSLSWLLIAILICDMIRDENDLERIFNSFIMISIFISILYIVHIDSFLIQYGGHASDIERSGWTNPNSFGGNIAIGGLLSIAYLTNLVKVTRSKFMTITCVITSILTFIVLILNASRGALLAFCIPSLLMLICSKDIKISYKLLLISSVCIIVVYMYMRSNIFDLIMIRISEDSVATGGGRTEIWKLKIDKFLVEGNIFDLLFGIGETATVDIGRYISTHNDIVTSFIAYGTVGLLLFVYFVFVYPIIKSNKNNRLFISIMILYMFVECNILEPFYRGYIVIIMFYFFILKYVLIERNGIKSLTNHEKNLIRYTNI